MPAAPSEWGLGGPYVAPGRDVMKVYVACLEYRQHCGGSVAFDTLYLRKAIISKHRVDAFRELGTARLVYAARVNPRPTVAVLMCRDAEASDFVRDEITRVLP